MDDVGQMFHTMRRNLIARQHERLVAAAGGTVDTATRRGLLEVATQCGPDTVDALVTLLCRVGAVAPHRLGNFPVVAFLRYRRTDGMRPVRGAAITDLGGGKHNTHTVWLNESTGRWEVEDSRHRVPWAIALAHLTRHAETRRP